MSNSSYPSPAPRKPTATATTPSVPRVPLHLALLLAVLLDALYAATAHAQSPQPEDAPGPVALAVGGPGCEPHLVEAEPPPGPPNPRISGLERCISDGSSDAFTLKAHNLVVSGQYSMELVLTTMDGGSLGFDPSCSETTKTYSFTGAVPAVTHSPTLYGCSGGFGVLHAVLRDAGAEVLRTGDYLVFVIPPPSPDDEVTGQAPATPTVSIGNRPTTVGLRQSSPLFTVTVSGLESSHTGSLELESSNTGKVAFSSGCSGSATRTWGSGVTQRTFIFGLYGCSSGTASIRVTVYQKGPSPGARTFVYRLTGWQVTVPGPPPTPPPTPPVPPAPAGLRVASTGCTSVGLDWDSRSGISKYEVSYGSTKKETAGSAYTATGLTRGTSYTFSVRAYGNGTAYRAAWGASASIAASIESKPHCQALHGAILDATFWTEVVLWEGHPWFRKYTESV